MAAPNSPDPMQMIARMLQPWQASLENPPAAQEIVLQSLLKIYAQTEYGAKFGASAVSNIVDYR
ncbi:MAG: hypothetical protein M0Q95_20755, partial [Porticoccaceae bacterium]|nr:hypothetical protein [Porticoccaceae bacterium]